MPILEFSLGPVQGFIAQARRTRDSAVGSFLLSYLAGRAMVCAAQEGGAEFIFPNTEQDPLFAAIKAHNGKGPDIGSLPNTFKATVKEGFDPNRCTDAVRTAWKEIADAIWEEFVESVASAGNKGKDGVRQIWDDQISGFWDMSWVLTTNEADGALAKRKNWRTHGPPVQPGDHCTLMGDWQELSGFFRTQDGVKQDGFWKALRERRGIGRLNLGDSERLCAIALVKRLFPLLGETKMQETIGWSVQFKNWPSVSYMAAVPWLEAIMSLRDSNVKEKAKAFLDAIANGQAFEDYNSEYHTKLEPLEVLAKLHPAKGLLDLDGPLLLPSSYETGENLPWEKSLQGPEKLKERRNKLKPLSESLKSLNDALGQKASPYYALLLMDGDEMGKLKGELQTKYGATAALELSSKLGEFSQGVSKIVEDHNGKTIFAGGDDVLALLPLTRVLEAACELRKLYQEKFNDTEAATISAAVVFAHTHVSLKSVIKQAHHLLDGVAKDGNGRDSIALMALNGNGALWEWVSTWDWQNDEWPKTSGKFNGVVDMIERVKSTFENDKFSSKFFYKLRERFETLTDEHHRGDLPFQKGLANVLQSLLVAEYLKTREDQPAQDPEVRLSEANQRVAELLSICRKRSRTPASNQAQQSEEQRTLLPDGALMVRFLARKGGDS